MLVDGGMWFSRIKKHNLSKIWRIISSWANGQLATGAEERSGNSWTDLIWWPAIASCFISYLLNHVLLLVQISQWGRESEADENTQLTLTLNQFTRVSTHHNSHHRPPPNPNPARADTLEAVVTYLHTGGSGHVVALFWAEAAVEFGSPLGVWAVLGIVLLTSMAWSRGYIRFPKNSQFHLCSRNENIDHYWHMECSNAHGYH